LVEQILTFSRQTGGERVSTDMAAVIEEARRFLRSTVPASIQIEVKIEPRCGRVMADVTQLNQVLLNLGTNAAHAMQASGGTIVFALAPVEFGANQAAAHGSLRSGPYLRLSVRDTGHGMDVETRRRIFEPFFTTKAANEGTGLGLAIVHGIVRSHGGAIEVNSAPGKGTAVEVYLPMEESADHVDATPNPVAPPEGRGQLICIVDDEQIVAQTAKLTLERLKYTTMVFHTPLECLAALKNTSDRCGLLLTDQTMPEMDGIELSAQVRAFAPRLPIIIMSGYFSKISPDALEEIGGVSQERTQLSASRLRTLPALRLA
jgi:CheY-like chemotaxis protein/two-component sensor histidine kinase